ncbi:MAG: hypothetical protein LBK13_02455 [Spirochaetales bacterium]|jgi:hypothetical protein|nr:hypothetical protein [Spirochaetales bacterium]
MKKNALFAALVLLIVFVFAGCSDSDDDGGNDFGDDGVSKSIKVTDFTDMDGSPSKVMFGIAPAKKVTAAIAVSAFVSLSSGDEGDAEGELFIADGINPTGTKWTGTGTYRIFIEQNPISSGYPGYFSKEKIKINSALTTLSFNDFREMQYGDWK